jgi:beta-lactamase superfamily II metal-dependent hydrolase
MKRPLMKKYYWPAIYFAAVTMTALPASSQTVGEALPDWSEGVLDIHHINTGKGDAAFFVLPDGTTMLVDAGAVRDKPPITAPSRPDSSREPGEWIARYVKRFHPKGSDGVLDYAVLTHFHGDHMGNFDEKSELAGNGHYRLSGISEVAEHVAIHKLIDRDWPKYNYPIAWDRGHASEYRAFVDWQIKNNDMAIERFIPGRKDQIELVNKPDKYPQFQVRNITSNGDLWTGSGDESRRIFPDLSTQPREDWPDENMCSIVFRMSYGEFNYYTGGDLPGIADTGEPQWHDVETPVGRVVGPVDVHVLNHHGYPDAANPSFLKSLQPRVNIISAWSPTHPGTRVMYRLLSERLYSGPRDIFITNLLPETKIVLGSWMLKFKSEQGHIVVRVSPSGAEYRVIILEATSEGNIVKAVHGPYDAS